MNSRERVRQAIRFQRPDYPPMLMGLDGAKIAFDFEWAKTLTQRFPDDFGIEDDQPLQPASPAPFRKGFTRVDTWGAVQQCAQDGVRPIVTSHPLSDWSRFSEYRPPVPERQRYLEIQARIARAGHPRYVDLGKVPGLFETMQHLRGYEALMCDLGEGREAVLRPLADLVFAVIAQTVEYICATDMDCIRMGDDWGTETGLMIAPELWRRFFKPYYRRLFDQAHAHGKDVWFHSCGCILPIVPDLIELGADILHPQLELLTQSDAFRPMVQGRICIVTDVDRGFLCTGEAPAVYQRAVNVFRGLYQPAGGLILRGELGFGVPRANAEAFLQACVDFRDSVRLSPE